MTTLHAIIPLASAFRLRVEFDYSPATPDVYYLPNGDPGYPGTPEEWEVTDVQLQQKWGTWTTVCHVDLSLFADDAFDADVAATLEAEADRQAAEEYEARRHADDLEDWNP